MTKSQTGCGETAWYEAVKSNCIRHTKMVRGNHSRSTRLAISLVMNLPPASRYQSAQFPSRASFVHGTLDGTWPDRCVVAIAVKIKNEFAHNY